MLNRSFEAEIKSIEEKDKIIKPNYQPIINTGNVRQAAAISHLSISNQKSESCCKTNLSEKMEELKSETWPDTLEGVDCYGVGSESEEKRHLGLKSVERTGKEEDKQIRIKGSKNIGEIRQTVEESKEIIIAPNSKTHFKFNFIYRPEYLGSGNYLIINDDSLHAIGRITKICYQ